MFSTLNNENYRKGVVAISIYSGKADVADWFDDCDNEYLKNSELYLSGQIVPLKIENQHDLAPYYPYLVVIGCGKDNHAVVHFSEKSFVDSEEEERLSWRLRDIQKYYRKCKKNKIPYTVENAISQACLFTVSENDRKIAEIVGQHGNRVTVHDLIYKYRIHSPLHEHYRKELLDEMVRLGWDERQAKLWIWKDLTFSDVYSKEDVDNDGN